MKFESKTQKRKVNETMASLLSPLKYHCDERTRKSIEITLRILQDTEFEEDEDKKDEEE
jgi:hypothetical protein